MKPLSLVGTSYYRKGREQTCGCKQVWVTGHNQGNVPPWRCNSEPSPQQFRSLNRKRVSAPQSRKQYFDMLPKRNIYSVMGARFPRGRHCTGMVLKAESRSHYRDIALLVEIRFVNLAYR